MRSRLLGVLAVLAFGCGANPPTPAAGQAPAEAAAVEPLDPAWLFLAEAPAEEGVSRVAPVDALVIAPSAELYLHPRMLVLGRSDRPAPDERGLVRFQVLVRVVRPDGGVTEWPVGAATTAPPGEGGRNLELREPGGATLVELGPARLGPVRTASVLAVEFVVTLLPSPAGEGLAAVGGLALEAAPPAGASEVGSRARAAATIRGAGGVPVMAVRVPVVEQGAPVPGRERQRLAVAVGGEGFGPTSAVELGAPSAGAPWPLRGRDGQALDGVSVLIIDVEVEVPEHAKPARRAR